MPDPQVLIFIAVAVAAVVFGIFGYLQARKRREAMMAWAASHGLTFDRSKDHSFDDQFPEFDCLRQGHRRYAYNTMKGEWEGRALVAFDYHYETYSTDSKGNRQTHHHYFSAVILRANIPLKPLVIRKEGFFDKVSRAFGYDDIDFESAEFSKRFAVHAPDRKWAYDVLHTRAMDHLLANPDYAIEFDRRSVIAAQKRKFTPEKFEHAISVIDRLLDMLPDYVRQQQQQPAQDPFT